MLHVSYERLVDYVRSYGGDVEGDATEFYGYFYYKGNYVCINSNKDGNWFDLFIGAFSIARYVKRVSDFDKYERNRCLEEHRNVEEETIPLHVDWYQEETLIACEGLDNYFSDVCITSTMYRFDEGNFDRILDLTLAYSEKCMDHVGYTASHSYVNS